MNFIAVLRQDSDKETAMTEKLSTLRDRWSAWTILFLTIVFFVAVTAVRPTFLSYNNVYSILYGVSIQFFAAIGFTLLLIMGEIDLSIGSVYAFSGLFVGLLMRTMKMPLWEAVLVSLAVATLFGILSGYLVVRFKVSSMMITIGTMTLIRGIVRGMARRLTGQTYSSQYRALAKIEVYDIFLTIIVMIVLAIVLEILLTKSSPFKKLYFIGENLETSRIYGLRAGWIKILIFGLSAFTAAVGGILISSRVTYADITIGEGLEFQVLTAAVLGGASLFGGKGSILRTLIGLIFLASITNAMIVFNIEPLLQQLLVGIILIVAVFIDTRLTRRNRT